MHSMILGASRKWNRAVSVLLRLGYSLTIMFSRHIPVVACARMSVLCLAEQYASVRIDHILAIHPSVYGHLGCFRLFGYCE